LCNYIGFAVASLKKGAFVKYSPTATLRLTATTCAALSLLASFSIPADAFFAGFPGDARASAMPRSDLGLQRTARPATRKTSTVAKTTPKPDELGGRIRGPLQIIVSLDKQELTLWSGSEVVARSRVSTGQRGFSTPMGVFSIIQKDRWHRSNLYDDAPMWYMQRITWSGVALHQGIVPNYPASHGCIRLPEAFARQLWGATQMGARVIVARDPVAPVEFAHPLLFAKRAPAPMVSQAENVRAAELAWSFAQLADTKPIAGMTMTDLTPNAPGAAPESAPSFDIPTPNARPLKPGPVAVFISRKEGKLFVRKGFEPVFETPIEIARQGEPIGTHVFTALGMNDDQSFRWTAVTVPSSSHEKPANAARALDRITIPPAAIARISELMSPGSSLVVSDHGLGPETGKGTDFIVLTR
jgi:lipoprotein-anchoring transpeptidase ErfK/SrfK